MGLPGMVGHALSRSVMPPPELVALMMSTFTPRPEEASCCIYVGNLVASITGDQLKQFFGASCGNVENVRVATEQEVTLAFRQANTGQTFAFVQFEQLESATTALTLSGIQLGDKPIKVFPAKLPPALVAHGGKGGDLGAMEKVMDVQARLAKRMKVRKDEEEAAAAEKADGCLCFYRCHCNERERTRDRELGRDRERDRDRARGSDRGRQYTLTQRPSKHFNIELNKQLMRISDTRELSAFVSTHAAEFNHINMATAFRQVQKKLNP